MASHHRALSTAMLLLLVACGESGETEPLDSEVGDATQPAVTHDASAVDASPTSSAGRLDAGPNPEASTPNPARDASSDASSEGDATQRDASGSEAGARLDAGATDAGTTDTGVGYAACPSDAPCKILPLGDSITYGLGYAGGYRVELFHKARADMKRVTFVGSLQNGPTMVDGAMFPRNNEGHSGWTIDQVAGLVPKPALNDAPHIVLLMAGTNDINLNTDLPNAPKRLGALIDKLIAANADALIVVAQITPLSRTSSALTTYNKALPEQVAMRASAGKHVLLVDMNTGFPDGGIGDGVHPNQKGYDWMAGVWYQAIASSLR
jgi:lysophospholipase L1-like esterase